MSVQYTKRQTKSYDDSPLVARYQFKAVDDDKAEEMKAEGKQAILDTIKVLKKGQEFTVAYQNSLVNEYKEKDGSIKKAVAAHFFTSDEGKISIKGCTSLNNGLAGLVAGSKVKIVFLGKGKKPKDPLRKAPFEFEVYDIIDESAPKKEAVSTPIDDSDVDF